MHARLTLLEIDTVRVSMATMLDRFRTEVVPLLSDQPGYRGVYALSTPEGKGALISFWETEEQASVEGDEQFYARALGSFATFFSTPPGRERYEVVFADDPALTG